MTQTVNSVNLTYDILPLSSQARSESMYSWLSQAEWIFNSLSTTTPVDAFREFLVLMINVSAHVHLSVIQAIHLELVIHGLAQCIEYHGSLPFLFLRQPETQSHGTHISICMPNPHMYWSFDPLGRQIYTDSRHLPMIKCTILAEGQSLQPYPYEALRKFHELKGFDPDTQDIAQYLGLPLFEHVEGEFFVDIVCFPNFFC